MDPLLFLRSLAVISITALLSWLVHLILKQQRLGVASLAGSRSELRSRLLLGSI